MKLTSRPAVAILTLLAGCDGGTASSPVASQPADPGTVVLQVDYGSEKKKWMEDMVQRFEATNPHISDGRRIDVQTRSAGSGEEMADILSGKSHAHVYSPASTAYLTLLNDEWLAQPGHTKPLAAAGDPLVLSPVVIAMWKPMAEALGWPGKPIGWKDLLKISAGVKGWGDFGHPEWGRFKLGHTHPGLSNSGLLAVLAEAYAGAGKTRGLVPDDLGAPGTTAFVASVEASLVHYGKSTTFLADKMVSRGPSYVSAAVLYENTVVESYAANPPPDLPIVAIYPVEGTFWSDHPFAVLDRPETGAGEREAASALLTFLKAAPQQQAALQYGFRPGDPSVAIGAPLDAAHGVDPLQPQTLLDVPDAATLRATLKLWDQTKKVSDVTLVFDKSGSMEGEALRQAKAGARAFLDSLGDRDLVSLQFFDNNVYRAGKPLPLGANRAALQTTVDGTIASGGTSLYDAVLSAYDASLARATRDPGTIHAVVVMTDGRDESSRTQLDALDEHLSGQAEAPVKVFTIAYGEHADPEVLGHIAEATKGMTSQGSSADITAVFQDMASFF